MAETWTDILGNLMLGVMGGALLAALGDVFSSTPLGVVSALVVGCAVGGLCGRLGSAIVGMVLGVMAAALGAVLTGSVASVVATVAGCGLLSAWLTWKKHQLVQRREEDWLAAHTSVGGSPVPVSPERSTN